MTDDTPMHPDPHRLTQVATALLNHGFTSLVLDTPLKHHAPWNARLAGRKTPHVSDAIRGTLCDLGGAFPLLGHLLSTRADLAPAPVREALRGLPATGQAIPFPYISAELQRSTGKAPHDVFKTIDETPLATDALTQTHRATLTNGTPVAVTVLKPNAERSVTNDLPTIRWLANALEHHPASHTFLPKTVLRALTTHVRDTLDLRTRLPKDAPRTHRELTTQRVLISHPLDAILASSGAKRDEHAVPDTITKRLAEHNVRVSFDEA